MARIAELRFGQDVLAVTEYLAAAFLKARGVPYLGAEAEAGRRVSLLFDNADGLAATLLNEHRNCGGTVNSAAFAAAVVQMKDEIFGARRER